jgi:hypothetical protein
MSTINVRRVKATAPHKTEATIRVPNEQGVVEETEITIFYRGLSMADADEFPETEGLEGEERNAAVRKQLAFLVTEIPEFVGDDHRPVETNEEFFNELDVEHLTAISGALREARSVPTKPTNS